MKRMDRYYDDINKEKASRSDKNQELYQDLGSNQRYTNFTDVTNTNAIDLSRTNKNYTTREGYHQMKEYETVMPTPKVKRELEDFNHLYQDHENKVYDINSVLEEARKNRIEKDELEAKRKLKNTNYNILASLNKEELEKYRKEKKEKVKKPNETELRELIDTITSKTLAGEIDKATSVDLLSDLMSTNIMNVVKDTYEKELDKEQEKKETEEEIDEKLSLSKEILDNEQIDKLNDLKETTKEDKNTLSNADTDFYTRSMDLSDKDFDMDDEFKEKSLPLWVKIIITIVILLVIGIAAFFIWKNFLS